MFIGEKTPLPPAHNCTHFGDTPLTHAACALYVWPHPHLNQARKARVKWLSGSFPGEVWVRRLPAIRQEAGQEQGVQCKLQEVLRHELRQEDDREGVGKLPGTQRQQ